MRINNMEKRIKELGERESGIIVKPNAIYKYLRYIHGIEPIGVTTETSKNKKTYNIFAGAPIVKDLIKKFWDEVIWVENKLLTDFLVKNDIKPFCTEAYYFIEDKTFRTINGKETRKFTEKVKFSFFIDSPELQAVVKKWKDNK